MTKIATETPNPIDVHVGKMIRAIRKAKGLSQEELANALGITFQQVQKYEKGSNRISASKLFDTAKTLDTQVGSFFDGLDATGSDRRMIGEFAEFLELDGSAALARAYMALTPVQRRRLVDLAAVMSPSR